MKSNPGDTSTGSGKVFPPADRTLRCRLVAEGASRPQTHLGDAPPIDMHGVLGMTDPAGGTKTSTLLLATLGSCLLERIRANAAIGSIEVTSLELEIEADLAVSPLWGNAGQDPNPIGFEAIEVRVHMDANAPEPALQALIKHAMIWSPVANTLHAPIHLDVSLVPKVVS